MSTEPVVIDSENYNLQYTHELEELFGGKVNTHEEMIKLYKRKNFFINIIICLISIFLTGILTVTQIYIGCFEEIIITTLLSISLGIIGILGKTFNYNKKITLHEQIRHGYQLLLELSLTTRDLESVNLFDLHATKIKPLHNYIKLLETKYIL